MRILVIEDDEKTMSYLARGLSESGFVVDRAADGELGLVLAQEPIYDVIIVDRMLPKLDGLELVSTLRKQRISVPVMMLSARGSPLDRVDGLRAGCDDYLAKPYAFAELLARLHSIARRYGTVGESRILTVGPLSLNAEQRVAIRGGKIIQLQLREFLLLQTLMRHSNAIVTRSMLLEAAWDYSFEPRGNIIDMHIHRLRKKIDTGFGGAILRTVAGAGYMLVDEPAAAASRPF